ncbi:MAG: hypothetical protein EHM18_03590 [Acidobacteria bacterium]|nr:MAG: hypothetical protein EHM18_03590 [Acidobacteriota bacterium]
MRGFSPRAGTITSGSHIAFGAAFQQQAPGDWPLDFEVSGLYSVRNYWTIGARIGRLRTRRETFLLRSYGGHPASEFNETRYKEPGFAAYADFNYFYFPKQYFFGFGPDSRQVDRTDYLQHTASYEAVAGYQITDWLGVSVRAGILQFDLDPGKDDSYTDTQTLFPSVPGIDRQPDFYRFSSALLVDNRDVPTDPRSGGVAGILFSRYRDKDSDEFEFNRYAVDLRHYFPIDPLLSVVALHFFSSVDDPIGQSQIPFYLNEWLGGGSTLRGFSRQRFRDRNLILLNGEFRIHVTDSLELAAFYDTGKVFRDLDDYNFKRLEKGYGGGVRLKGGNILFLRFDVAHSREGTHIHVSIGPAF